MVVLPGLSVKNWDSLDTSRRLSHLSNFHWIQWEQGENDVVIVSGVTAVGSSYFCGTQGKVHELKSSN